MKVFQKDGKNAETTKTAPNTPEEEDDRGVTVVANEIDPLKDLLSPATLQQISSPIRGDFVPTSARFEEKKEDHSVPGDQAGQDVVSKTLNFFDDMCVLPKMQITSDGEAGNINESSVVDHRAGAYDDMTSLPSETTGNSSANPSTIYSNSHVSSLNNYRSKKSSAKPRASGTQTSTHDHENFEVVLDPASMTKEEKSKYVKQKSGKRWKGISKSFKKEKNQPDANDLIPESFGEPGESPPLVRDEAEDAPLDEEIGRLGAVPQPARKEFNSEHDTKNPKASLAKKIWKNCKKTLKGEQNQQSHKAEIDSEAAVVRSLEAKSDLEEQGFLELGLSKQGVEPILEGNESEEGGDVNVGDEKPLSPMAKTWDDIASASLSTNLIDDQKNLDNGEQAFVPEKQSSEDSPNPANKKPTHRRTNSLGRRLKNIRTFTSTKKATKNKKVSDTNKGEIESANSQSANSAAEEHSSTPGSEKTEKAQVIRKPKLVWKSVVDPNSRRTYYYHRKTRETTWRKPEEMKLYEVAYKKWRESTSRVDGSEAERDEPKKHVDMKEEGKVFSTRSASWPKTVSSDDAKMNENTNNDDLHRKSTPPSGKVTIPVQISENTLKDSKEQDSFAQQRGTVDEDNKGVKIFEKEKETSTKQPFDESKPIDESTPFDEPLADTNGPGLLFLPKSPARFGRTMTYMSKASARSALTDRTEKIRNTGKGRFSGINPINENMSTATSISSIHDSDRLHSGRVGITSYRIPSRVPVHRERQLMVEELTDARLSAESYEGHAGERRGRIVRGRAREVEPTPEVYEGDNDTYDDYGASTFDNDTYGTDSVSALSENDTDFLNRRDGFDQARRRALDAAIEIEDWDLAAALSDGMRAVNLPGGYEKAHSSWNQSELDKFIANNDWNAVKSYIAKMREQSKKEQGNGASDRKSKSSPANKRVGSRSQMQHRDVMSESSWSGSDSQSSYETYDSESEI